MKLWYDCLGVPHPIQLTSLFDRIYYKFFVFLFTLLRFRLLYSLISWIFFYFQNSLFDKMNVVDRHVDVNYKTVKYELAVENDLVTECETSHPPLKQGNMEQQLKHFYRVNNFFYKPNV